VAKAYRFGRCELRPSARALLVSGRLHRLPARAFDVLVALVERRGRVVPKSELLEIVWPGKDVCDSNVEVQVFAIRAAIGRQAIVTVPGRGYRFDAAVDPFGDRSSAPVESAGRHSGPRAEEVARKFRETPDRGLSCPEAAEHDRLTAIFERAAQDGRAEEAAWAGEALARIDTTRNVYTTMARRQQLAFELLPLARTRETRARLWTCAAFSRHTASAVPKLEAGKAEVAAWRRVGDQSYLYEALARHAAACGSAGRFREARKAIAEARALEPGDWPAHRRVLLAFADATVAAFGDNPARFLVLVAAEERLARQAGSARFVGNTRLYYAEALLNLGRTREALAVGDETLRLLAGWEHCLGYSVATALRCHALLAMSLDAEAAASAGSVLPHAAANGVAGWFYDVLAVAAARGGRHRQSAILLGYADAWYAAMREIRRMQDRRCAIEAHARNIDAFGGRYATWLRNARAALREARARTVPTLEEIT